MATAPSEPVRTRRGRPGYDRDAVLEIAVAAFNEHGYDATSIGTLAERLGLSRAAIYHHFDSKEQLLASALDHALDELEGVLAAADAAGGSAGDRLALVLERAVHVLVARLPYVTLLLRLRGNTEVERAALRRRRDFDREVAELIAQARDAGDVRDDIDPRIAARLLFGMVNSIVEWYRPGGAEDADQIAADVLAVAVGGLRLRGQLASGSLETSVSTS